MKIESESIKEMMVKLGLDPNHILAIEYKKSQIYLQQIIVKTEKSLIDIQKVDGLDVVSERQKSIEKILGRLIFAHNKLVQMEALIYSLTKENEMLNERLKLRV